MTICGDNSNCFNTNGSYYCQCRAGFENLQKGRPTNFTAKAGQCIGKFKYVCVYECRCVCALDHVTLTVFSFVPLSDTNECIKNKNICGKLAKCENLIGSYRCVCPSGYVDKSNDNRTEHCEGECCILLILYFLFNLYFW